MLKSKHLQSLQLTLSQMVVCQKLQNWLTFACRHFKHFGVNLISERYSERSVQLNKWQLTDRNERLA